MINKVEKVITDNIPLMDELVYNLKKAALQCVLKDNEDANKDETAESIKNADRYIACIEGIVNFNMFQYDKQDLLNVGVPETLLLEYSNNNRKIPEHYRKTLTKLKAEDTIDNYIEYNNYYRMLNGLPNLNQKGIKIESFLIPEGINVDCNKYIHEMTVQEQDVLYAFNIIDNLIIRYPEHKYLEFLGSKKIPYYIARKAKNFELIYLPNDIPKEVAYRFREKIELNRVYTLKTIYSDAFKFGSDYYDKFIKMFIVIQTMIDIITELPDFIIKRELFDIRTVELVFKSNGIDVFPEIPFKYQMAMIRNLNTLIKYKSTTKNIVDICSLFGFDNIEVFKYYILKQRKTDHNGEYIFNFKEDGEEDINKDYDLKFLKVPIDDIADNHLHDNSKYLDYDEVVSSDKYWNGDLSHDYVKSKIIEQEFNYLQSKYLSVDTLYSLAEMGFELVYFYNMLFDNVKIEEKLMISVPTIGQSKFRFLDLICYLYALMYEYNGAVDDLMDTPTKVLTIKGFNFKANMAELGNYVREKGFTLEELGVADFQIPETNILTYKQLMTIFTKNKNIHDHIIKQMVNADNKAIYDIYKKLYDSLLIIELSMDFFKLSDGTVATTYTDFLKERDLVLYKSINELRALDNTELKKEKIINIINDSIYLIEQELESDEYKFLFSNLPSVSSEAIKQYIYKVVNFFKSYKVDIMSINTIYLFDDKLENKIMIIDEVLFKYIYTRQDVIDLISKLKSTIKLTKKDKVLLVENIYKTITHWFELFFKTHSNIYDNINQINVSEYKKDKCDVVDEKELISKLIKRLCMSLDENCYITSVLNKEEKDLLIEKVYKSITYWVEIFSKTKINLNDNFYKMIIDQYKEDKFYILDNKEIITRFKRLLRMDLQEDTSNIISLNKNASMGLEDDISIIVTQWLSLFISCDLKLQESIKDLLISLEINNNIYINDDITIIRE